MFAVALNSMLSLFLCMIVGFLGIRFKFLKKEMIPIFNNFLLNITFPAMMISILNIQLTNDILKITPSALALGLLYNIILWIIAIILIKIFRISKDKRSILTFSFIFTNVGFIGFPLIESVFGQQGLVYLSMFNIVFNILAFTFGVYILQENSNEKQSLKKILTTPIMISMWIGLILLFSQIPFPHVFVSEDLGATRLPYFISKALSMIGDITSPLAMIIVGATLAETNIKKVLLDIRLHTFSLFKLILAPLIVYFILRPFVNNDTLLTITVVLSGLPTATLSVILAEEFKLDYVLVSEIVFITTLYSVIITPLLFCL